MKKLRAKMDEMMVKAATKMNNLMAKKEEGIDGFIVVIIIVVICLAVGVVFREQIINFITNFFAQFNTRTNALF